MAVSPPRPRLPQLNALRAFEAAARLNSIAVAAEELCVTPAAVAQQIKSLEAWVGDALFKRHVKGVDLTPLGASVLADFTDAFDALAGAVQKLRLNANPFEVRIAALPSAAQLWVSPRLPAIRRAMPEISVSVTALERPPNLQREPFDLAIFYEERSGVSEGTVISGDVIFPVCAPVVAERLRAVTDLTHETFLHDTSWSDDWQRWLAVASPAQNLNKSGPEFSLYSLAVEECQNGAGVLIGHDALVRPHLESGRLVAPFDLTLSLPRDLIYRTNRPLTDNPILANVVERLVSG